MRHAWLIITHNEFGILQRLISALDEQRNDIYVHFDKKVRSIPMIYTDKSRLFVLDNRIDVRWGTVSQIKTEFALLETASKNGPYDHYHIISGTHLPLVSVQQLLAYYDQHANQEIVRLWDNDSGDADFKLRRIHFPLRWYKSPNKILCSICQFTWKINLCVQRLLCIRINKNNHFVKTDNWLSITEQACQNLLYRKHYILKKYRWSFCGDEYFIGSELSEKECFSIYNEPYLLYVEFVNDSPRSLSLQDYYSLKDSGYLWGRKFSTGKE